MHDEAGDVTIPALPAAAGLPTVGAGANTSEPTEMKSAVQRAVIIATRRQRRDWCWA